MGISGHSGHADSFRQLRDSAVKTCSSHFARLRTAQTLDIRLHILRSRDWQAGRQTVAARSRRRWSRPMSFDSVRRLKSQHWQSVDQLIK